MLHTCIPYVYVWQTVLPYIEMLTPLLTLQQYGRQQYVFCLVYNTLRIPLTVSIHAFGKDNFCSPFYHSFAITFHSLLRQWICSKLLRNLTVQLTNDLKIRTSDSQPSVRAKSLEALASILNSLLSKPNGVAVATYLLWDKGVPTQLDIGPIVNERTSDSKPIVRKSLLSVIDAVFNVARLKCEVLLRTSKDNSKNIDVRYGGDLPKSGNTTGTFSLPLYNEGNRFMLTRYTQVQLNEVATQIISIIPSYSLELLSFDSSLQVRQKAISCVDKLRGEIQ